jgi:hypothetical protein
MSTHGSRLHLLRSPLLCALALLAGACDTASTGEAPARPQWTDPVPLGSAINTTGWEDSGYVLPDGSAFYFTYLRIDPIRFILDETIRLSGPRRPGWPTEPPFDTHGAEIYVSYRRNGSWQPPDHVGPPINLPHDLEGGAWVSEDERRILFMNGIASPDRPRMGIYYAEKVNGQWTTPVYAADLGFPFVEHDENPHLTRDERTLLFESSRPGGFGQQDLWMARRVDGGWTEAVNLGPAVNTDGVEGSPFSLEGGELLWDTKGGGSDERPVGIYWSKRRSDGTWQAAERVLPGVFGDPSLTLDGDLYVIGGRAVEGGYDADAYLARHLPVERRVP